MLLNMRQLRKKRKNLNVDAFKQFKTIFCLALKFLFFLTNLLFNAQVVTVQTKPKARYLEKEVAEESSNDSIVRSIYSVYVVMFFCFFFWVHTTYFSCTDNTYTTNIYILLVIHKGVSTSYTHDDGSEDETSRLDEGESFESSSKTETNPTLMKVKSTERINIKKEVQNSLVYCALHGWIESMILMSSCL